MTELISNIQIRAFNALVAAPEAIARFEVAISDADEIYQEEIAPLICMAPVLLAEGVIIAFKWFIQASYWTFITGEEFRDWYENEWVGQSALIPVIERATAESADIIRDLKQARAALLLAQESDRLAQDALAYVVDQVVKLSVQQPEELVPDFWWELPPIAHTPPVYGEVWSPRPRDMHQDGALLLSLQTVPLLMPAAQEQPIAVRAKATPKSRQRKPRGEAQTKEKAIAQPNKNKGRAKVKA